MFRLMSGVVLVALSGTVLAAFDTQHVDPAQVHAKCAAEAEALFAPAYAKYKAEVEDPWNAKAKAANAAWNEARKKDPNAPRPDLGRRPPYTGPQRLPDVLVMPEFEAKVDAAYGKDLAAFKALPEEERKGKRGPDRRLYVKALKDAGDTNYVWAVGARGLGDRTQVGFKTPIAFKTAGSYALWVNYWRTADLHARLAVRFQAPNSETTRYTFIDPLPDANVNQNADGRSFATGLPQGFVWAKVPVNVEYPGEYTLSIVKFDIENPRGVDVGKPFFAVKDIWVSNDPAFDPEKNPVATDMPTAQPSAPGFVAATPHAPHVSLNTAVMDTQKRLPLMLMECYQHFSDSVNRINLGATDGLEYNLGNSAEDTKNSEAYRYGATVCVNADGGRGPYTDALFAKYPYDARKPIGPGNEPVGRQGWWDEKEQCYKYNGRVFCDSFEEYREAYYQNAKKNAEAFMANPCVDDLLGMWWTAWEQCGSYDYGETSRKNYRKFLAKNYGTIAKLNAAWHTAYGDFSEIEPEYWAHCCGPEAYKDDLKRRQAMANFIDFRDFCSKSYAELIALKTKASLEADPKKRHVSSNLSCNNLSSVMWMRWRPLSFEDTARITMKGSDMIGYDNYGTDDLNGANYELFDAFGDGKLRPMIREGSTHAPSPELFARSQFGLFSKGMRGMACFCMQENGLGELTKFGLENMHDDAAPRPKLAALSDNFRAMNQLAHVLGETKRTRAVKPVAIYYSSICNVLQEQPYASIFDCGPDNFFRVYELLHANGYAVTFVTDTHFREHPDWIDNCAAIFFVDATYIPSDVQDGIKAWVEKGGHVVVDAQGGSCDGHGFPTPSFTEWLGIQPVQQQKFDENEAASKLAFGYSAYSFDVIQRDALYKTAVELKDATMNPTHPVARAAGKVMMSAMGYQDVRNVAGETILAENNGRPAWVIRKHGKGTSSYFAAYLGTAFGAGCTQYEWRDKHADNSPYRFLDAYLAYVGAKKIAVNDIAGDARYYVRHESPLTDARGNAAVGIVSQNPSSLPSFRAKYLMPAGFKAPKTVLAARNATRELVSVPFAYDERTRELSLRLPSLHVWTMALALNDAEPLVSVAAGEAKRDAYGLVDFRPGDVVEYRVRVHNPSPRKLAVGEVELRLPAGWFCDGERKPVAAIGAYGASDELVFKVKAPAVNAARRLRPVNFVYRAGAVTSSPAVEMVWFQKEAQAPASTAFGVK